MHDQSQKLLFSVNDFCEVHSMSRATFYRILAAGQGPKTVQLGDRKMITAEAAAEWRKSLPESK